MSALLFALPGCGDSPDDPDMSDAKYIKCLKKEINNEECEEKTVVLFGKIYKDKPKAPMYVRPGDCSGDELTGSYEKEFNVYLWDLPPNFASENLGKCIQIFGETKKGNRAVHVI